MVSLIWPFRELQRNMQINEQALKELTIRCYPFEACALITESGEIVELTNSAKDKEEHFKLSPEEFFRFCLAYNTQPVGLWHSHTRARPGLDIRTPSEKDISIYNQTGCFLYISGYDGKTYYPSVRFPAPPNQLESLLNRPYIAGIQDCGTLVRDAYLKFYDIHLKYEFKASYLDPRNWSKAVFEFLQNNNFRKLEEGTALQKGDILVVSIEHLKASHGVMVLDDTMRILNQGKISVISSIEDFEHIDSAWRLL